MPATRSNFIGSVLGLDSNKVWPDYDPLQRFIFRRVIRMSLTMGAAIHECGGARMGDDPRMSVVNGVNQTWDIPNLFVTDGASFASNSTVGPALHDHGAVRAGGRVHRRGARQRPAG